MVDTKTFTTSDGSTTKKFLVMDDPCKKSGCNIPAEAPEVVCSEGSLNDATTSENGKVIIGPFFDSVPNGAQFNTRSGVDTQCKERAEDGFHSGMGQIFREVATCGSR